jgi:hypothetical protein
MTPAETIGYTTTPVSQEWVKQAYEKAMKKYKPPEGTGPPGGEGTPLGGGGGPAGPSGPQTQEGPEDQGAPQQAEEAPTFPVEGIQLWEANSRVTKPGNPSRIISTA